MHVRPDHSVNLSKPYMSMETSVTNTLIEAVARGIYNAMSAASEDQQAQDFAIAAIAAIEASGTHRVVPVVPTEKIKDALASHLFHVEPEPTYAAMLAAAPSVLSY